MKCSNVEFAIFELHTKTISSGKITEENLTKCLKSIKNEPLIIKTISNESIAKIQDIFKNLSETLNKQEPDGFIKKLKKIGLIRDHIYKRLYISGHDFCHTKTYIKAVMNNELFDNKKYNNLLHI